MHPAGVLRPPGLAGSFHGAPRSGGSPGTSWPVAARACRSMSSKGARRRIAARQWGPGTGSFPGLRETARPSSPYRRPPRSGCGEPGPPDASRSAIFERGPVVLRAHAPRRRGLAGPGKRCRAVGPVGSRRHGPAGVLGAHHRDLARPMRFSVSAWPTWSGVASLPFPVRQGRQSSSVAGRCVPSGRRARWKPRSRLRPPPAVASSPLSSSSLASSSTARKLLIDARASICVPSTGKWSCDRRPFTAGNETGAPEDATPRHRPDDASRFLLNTIASRARSPIPGPTDQRGGRANSNPSTGRRAGQIERGS